MLVLSHLTGKKILLKYLVYFGAFLPFAVIILVLSFRHENIINDFFAKPFLLHFLFCYFSFPFFLIFLRVNRINKIKYKMQSNAFFAYFWIILLFIIFFLFYSIDLINVHESEKIARIVFENNYITGESFFHIKPLHSAGIVNVKAGSEYYKVKPNEEKVIKSNAAEKPYSTELIKRGSRVTFRLISSEKIKNLFVTIKCPEGVIFSSINQRYSFMYKNEKAGADYYKVWIPSNPGNEVFINLEFLRGHEYQIVYRVEYNFLKDGELETDFDFVEYKTIYEDEVSVKL